MTTKTITITDPAELAKGPRVGDLVTERVTAVGVNGEYDTDMVSVEREVPDVAPGVAGTATVHGYTGIRVVRGTTHDDDAWWLPVASIETDSGPVRWPHDSHVTDFVPDQDGPATQVTRAQVFDILYPDGILPFEDQKNSKIDALIALFGGAR